MDWGGWATFGLVATVLLTAVLTGAQLAGLTRMRRLPRPGHDPSGLRLPSLTST